MYTFSLLVLFGWISAIRAQDSPVLLDTLQRHRVVAEQLIPYTAEERVRVAQESQKMFAVSL
jgi:hypothetical protein